MKSLWIPILAAALTACAGSTAPPPPPVDEAEAKAPAHAGIDIDDPTVCAGCHAAVVTEWQTSMHAQAHHSKDEIHGAMRSLRMAKQGEQIAGKCAQCHEPRDTQDLESTVAKTGVSCATCHNLADVDRSDGKKGAKALVWAEPGVLRGVHDTVATAPHGVGAPQPALVDGSTVCLACHDATKTPAGADACTTGPEYAENEADPGSCTSCHMPEVDGPSGAVSQRPTHRSHAFVGPHRAWYSDDPVTLDAVGVTATLQGNTLTATLENRSGHGFPTGFPGRIAVVKAVALGADGEPMWTNLTDDPMKQDPDAVLNKVYVDADGKPTMPPFAKELKRDSRLKAAETRTLTWTVPAGAAAAEVKVVYRLLPPPAAKALGLTEHPKAAPRVIATARAEAPATR